MQERIMRIMIAAPPTQLHTYQATKRIYRRFQKASKTFHRYIQGIANETEQKTYTILMLKRLLVLYFIQQQGLLDADTSYLSHRLQYMQQTFGHDTFYRHFLLPLCYECLSQQQQSYAGTMLFGTVPASGIALFEQHALEYSYPTITIADEAFTQLFALFDCYQWRLDGHPAQADDEVHPQMLSYIFEQHINQKQIGAYYTGENVTSYIAKNTLVPALFAIVRKQCPEALAKSSMAWHLLMNDPDEYIHPSMYSTDYLPTETEREYKLRRTRYELLTTVLQTGTVCDINDLVTYNLDILRFAEHVILTCSQPNTLLAFYRATEQMTILDPTCGSGAFLCAALTILEVLYHACLTRMQTLMDEYIYQTTWQNEDNQVEAAYHALFEQIALHPNRQHFILTRIMAHNLHGVDVMEEAIEICKLRLYLALLASITRLQDVPSLPSLNLQIYAGNALVGKTHRTDSSDFSSFTPSSGYSHNNSQAQSDDDFANQTAISAIAYDYKKCQRPFHWYEAFPQIMQSGGFDVIIGNPPYIEYSKVRHNYTIDGYKERSCGNLYAAVIERSLTLCRSQESYLGLLVPLSVCGSTRFEYLRGTLMHEMSHLWLANFDIFPCRLFDGVFQRLSILLARRDPSQQCTIHTTRIHRWYAPERPSLINLINYTPMLYVENAGGFPKLASKLQEEILSTMRRKSAGQCIASVLSTQKTPYFVYYQEATNYWAKAVCQIPFYKKNNVVMKPPHGRFLFFADELTAWTVMALMNSSLFYIWFATYSDGFHLSHALVKDFPVDGDLYALKTLSELAIQLQNDIQAHVRISTRNTRPDAARQGLAIELEEYRMGYSKAILDEIDYVLARHYGFNNEKLDFIVNYDRKYRMGQDKILKMN
jgi:hypothetical protein